MLAGLVLRILTKLALRVWWSGISSEACSDSESADGSSDGSSPGTTASTPTGVTQYILESPGGRILVESCEYVPADRAYVLDVAAACGPFYDEAIHGPPKKVIVRDAEAFVESLRENADTSSMVMFGVPTSFN